jgi:hypothetical protein
VRWRTRRASCLVTVAAIEQLQVIPPLFAAPGRCICHPAMRPERRYPTKDGVATNSRLRRNVVDDQWRHEPRWVQTLPLLLEQKGDP